MKIEDLVVKIAERECEFRPFRLEKESNEDYRRALGTTAPVGPFAVDLVPDINALSAFVTTLTTARLANLDRGALEVEYREGLWSDAWDGFFYYPALLIPQLLAYDPRLAEAAEFAGCLRYFHGVRTFRQGPYLFLKRAQWKSHMSTTLSLYRLTHLQPNWTIQTWLICQLYLAAISSVT